MRRLLVAACAITARAPLIASSSLEQCFDNGEAPLDCDQSIVVSLAIASGQRGTEEIRTVLGCDEGERVQTPNREASTCELEAPIRLSLTKTEAVVRYPVTYLQSFNAAPREVVTHHGLGGCEDGDMSAAPSCGWVLASDGARIQDSQGFCCSCGFDQMLGASSTSTRSTELHCNLFGSAQSAHCLRMDELWYAAYTLGPPQLHFTVTVSATQANGTMAEYTLELGPHAPGAASPDGRVTARLLGDLAAYTGDMPPLGQSNYLMVPSQPASHARVLAGVDAWLLVDRQAVTLDGMTCNKIGTSYAAFRHQPSVCLNQAGSCLRNQLEDLQLVDDQRIQRGEPPLYRASGLGAFAPYADAAGAQYVAYTTNTARNSLVTLTLDADRIQFVIADSTGHIDSIAADDFEAQSARGRLVCAVTNTGSRTADYSLRVECTDGIMGGIPARTLSLAPSEQRHITFPLYAERTNASEHTCTGHLFGPRQTLLSAANVSFFTTERIEDRGAQAGEIVAAPGRIEIAPQGSSLIPEPCQHLCSGLLDLACFLAFGCSSKLAVFSLVLCFVLVCIICCCCFCCCFCRSASFRGCVFRILCCGSGVSSGGGGGPHHRYSPSDHAGHIHHQPHEYQHWPSAPPRHPPPRGRGAWRSSLSSDSFPRDVEPKARVSANGDQPVVKTARGSRIRTSLTSRRRQPDVTRHTAFLNMSGAQAAAAAKAASHSWLRPPGVRYSLRGEVVVFAKNGVRTAPLEADFFHLGSDGLQYWRWSESQSALVLQPRPTRLNRGFFRVPFNNSDGSNLESLQIVTPESDFPCINIEEPIDEPRLELQSADAFNRTLMPESVDETVDDNLGVEQVQDQGGEQDHGGHEKEGEKVRDTDKLRVSSSSLSA